MWEALHPCRGSSKCKSPMAVVGFPLARLAGYPGAGAKQVKEVRGDEGRGLGN